jgi:TolB-like protein
LSFFQELKRRNVFRVGAAYLVFSWLLVQLVETILPAFGFGDAAVRNVVILLALGFVPALVVAWAFELTEDGFKRDSDVDRSTPGASISPRVLNRALIVLLVAAVSFFAFDRFVLERELLEAGPDVAATAPGPKAAVPADERSVAVLPFVAMSSGADDEYFADGLTEEILNSLASLPELLVTARTSAFHFKGTDLPVPDIAATLGVAHVVEGSVRRSGERVRITAQLIRAADGFHLWSQTYDRTLEDIFAVQEDIAQSIAEVLDVVLDQDALKRMRNAGIDDVEAFIAYQKGNEAFTAAHTDLEHIAEALETANRYYDQALAVAPRVLEARLKRTDRAGHVLFEIAAGFRPEAWPGEGAAAQAELMTDYSAGWEYARTDAERATFEVERTLFSDDWSGFSAKMDAAMQGDECVPGNWIYQLGAHVGWAEPSVKRLRINLRCDPLSGVTRMGLVQALTWAGDPAAALEVLREADELGVTVPFNRAIRLIAMLSAGHFRDYAEAPMPVPDGALYAFDDRLLVEASAGDAAEAQRLADEYRARPDAEDWSGMVAAAVLGDREAANAAAARIDARPGGPFMLAIGSEMCFCGAPFDLDATPNFKARLEESGFAWPPRMPIDYPLKDW